MQLLTSCLSNLLLNLAIWVFSFRYWKISFVIPMQLAGKEATGVFRAVCFTIFTLGFLLNLLVPVLNSYYGFKINEGVTEGARQI